MSSNDKRTETEEEAKDKEGAGKERMSGTTMAATGDRDKIAVSFFCT